MPNKPSANAPKQVHTFAGNPLNRGETLRRSELTIEAMADDPNSLYLPFHRLKVATVGEQALAWVKRADLNEVEQPIYLGMQDDIPHFACNVAEPDNRDIFIDCRQIAAHLAVEETGILAQARAQLDWHKRNQFCAECGQPSHPERGGQVRRCSACTKHIFPRTDPVAIMLIVDQPGGDRCLLGKSQGVMAQTNFFSALAGFLDQGESLEEAVRREVFEEAGLIVGHVQYHSSQPWPFPSQLMIGCHGVAETHDITIDEQEMAEVKWFTRAEAMSALAKTNAELRVPGELAIAHHLIRSWAHGEVVI